MRRLEFQGSRHGQFSVHPRRPRVAVFLTRLARAGIAEVTEFVEVVIVPVIAAVVLAHVDLELARRALPLPAVVSVAEAEPSLRGCEAKAATGNKLQEDVSEQCAAEVGHVGDGLSSEIRRASCR